jgi:electron transfer flavoprotein alpha subunit
MDSAAAINGVQHIVHVDAEHLQHPLAEDVANIVTALGRDYQVILAAHSSFSRSVLPRAAALLDVAMISDVLEIKSANTYVRSIYAGNIHATVQSVDPIQVLTVHGSNFSVAGSAESATGHAEIVKSDAPPAFGKTHWVAETHNHSDRPALSSANVVISGGRSLGSAEKFEQTLSPLAAKLGAALGATRAAVDAGYAPNEIQVGQTGVVVAPDLYIAVGVSGAVQHTYGMKDSRVVVAINQDPDAPIFQVADYGLVADLFEAVPALTSALNNR